MKRDMSIGSLCHRWTRGKEFITYSKDVYFITIPLLYCFWGYVRNAVVPRFANYETRDYKNI